MPTDRVQVPTRSRSLVSADLAELLTLAWPVVFARLGIMAMGLTDAIVVGHYSSRELSFNVLAWAPTSIVLVTGVGLLQGVQVMTARHIGEGRPNAAGGVLRRGLVYSVVIGLISIAISLTGGPWLLHALGLQRDLVQGATMPMQVFVWSLPAYLAATACTYFLEALEKPLPGMIFMWGANALNLAVDLWLVPGTSGLPVDGAVAAAFATLASRVALMIALAVYIVRMPEARALGLFAKPVDGPDAAREQLRIGLGSGASQFIEIGAFAAMTMLAGRVSGLEAAAWAVVINTGAFIFMGPLGLSAATAVLVGRAYGAKDSSGVARAGFLGLGVTVVLMLVVCLFVGLFPGMIARGYTSDPALIALIAPALLLSCLFYLPDGLQVVGAQALRARGDVWIPTFCHLASYWVVMVPLAIFFELNLHWGLNGIVWAVIVASLLSGALQVGRFTMLAQSPRS
jgi:MATE family multidrug resistance protein